jgi:hypothetical protein
MSSVNYTISTSRPALCMMQSSAFITLRGAHLVTDLWRESINPENSYKLPRTPIPDRSFGLSITPDSSRHINIRTSVKWNSKVLITSS